MLVVVAEAKYDGAAVAFLFSGKALQGDVMFLEEACEWSFGAPAWHSMRRMRNSPMAAAIDSVPLPAESWSTSPTPVILVMAKYFWSYVRRCSVFQSLARLTAMSKRPEPVMAESQLLSNFSVLKDTVTPQASSTRRSRSWGI